MAETEAKTALKNEKVGEVVSTKMQPVLVQRQVGQIGIGGDAYGAARQAKIQFRRFRGVVPPNGSGVLDDPLEIRILHNRPAVAPIAPSPITP